MEMNIKTRPATACMIFGASTATMAKMSEDITRAVKATPVLSPASGLVRAFLKFIHSQLACCWG